MNMLKRLFFVSLMTVGCGIRATEAADLNLLQRGVNFIPLPLRISSCMAGTFFLNKQLKDYGIPALEVRESFIVGASVAASLELYLITCKLNASLRRQGKTVELVNKLQNTVDGLQTTVITGFDDSKKQFKATQKLVTAECGTLRTELGKVNEKASAISQLLADTNVNLNDFKGKVDQSFAATHQLTVEQSEMLKKLIEDGVAGNNREFTNVRDLINQTAKNQNEKLDTSLQPMDKKLDTLQQSIVVLQTLILNQNHNQRPQQQSFVNQFPFSRFSSEVVSGLKQLSNSSNSSNSPLITEFSSDLE